jgi:hypothetical protein
VHKQRVSARETLSSVSSGDRVVCHFKSAASGPENFGNDAITAVSRVVIARARADARFRNERVTPPVARRASEREREKKIPLRHANRRALIFAPERRDSALATIDCVYFVCVYPAANRRVHYAG